MAVLLAGASEGATKFGDRAVLVPQKVGPLVLTREVCRWRPHWAEYAASCNGWPPRNVMSDDQKPSDAVVH